MGGIRWAVYVAVYVFPRMCNEREWRSNPRKESENRRAGRRVVRTKPANTSKRCARCGYVVEKGCLYVRNVDGRRTETTTPERIGWPGQPRLPVERGP